MIWINQFALRINLPPIVPIWEVYDPGPTLWWE
jgi:hypothetical protein